MADFSKHQPKLPSSAPTSLSKHSPGSVPAPPTSGAKALEKLKARAATKRQLARAILLVDCSSSMAEVQKLQQAKSGAVEFADSAVREGYDVAVISFENRAALVLAATKDKAEIARSVQTMRAAGTTNMADAFRLARKELENLEGTSAVVVVTDGQPNDYAAARDEAEALKRLGIDIITVGTSDADDSFLRSIATRADFSSIVSAANLKQAIRDSARLLARPSP